MDVEFDAAGASRIHPVYPIALAPILEAQARRTSQWMNWGFKGFKRFKRFKGCNRTGSKIRVRRTQPFELLEPFEPIEPS
jgi:hypothetical protein